jgi:CheY-like chemotaxis protein
MGCPLNLTMLMVEDNPADVVLFTKGLETTQTPAACHVVTNGKDAMRFLRREAPFVDARRPDVVILYLNLPVNPTSARFGAESFVYAGFRNFSVTIYPALQATD